MMDGVLVSGMVEAYRHDKKVLELRVIDGRLYLRDDCGWRRVDL